MNQTLRLIRAASLLALALPLAAQDPASETIALKSRTIHAARWNYVLPGESMQPADQVMSGTVAGVPVTVIDVNGDGRWNDPEKDALVVGNAVHASYVSKVANLNGKLYELEISDDGSTVKAMPFTGPAGTLDMKSEFKCQGKLENLVLRSEKNDVSFNLAASKGVLVPAGRYRIVHGVARKDKEVATIGQGKMPTIVVSVGATTTPKWGSAITAEFDVTRSGDQITVEPNLKFYGRGGEEYLNFQPNLKSPKFFVFDKKSKKLIASGRFGGC
jgi:hypothetical protein